MRQERKQGWFPGVTAAPEYIKQEYRGIQAVGEGTKAVFR